MSESTSLDQLKKAYEELAFVHQVLTQRTSFYLQEVDIAKASTQTITDMANKLSDEIKARMEAEEAFQAATTVEPIITTETAVS